LENLGTIALVLLLVCRNREPLRSIGLRKIRWWAEPIWAFFIFVVTWGVAVVISRYMETWFGRAPDHETAARPLPGGLHGLMIPAIIFLSALSKEIFMRGYVWHRLQLLTGRPVLSLLFSALLFTGSHSYSWRGLVHIFAFGLIMGFFFWKGRSLPRLVMAHTVFNLTLIYHWGRY
jgi:membrane protease YdiL (CAAX protease family)